MKKYLSVNKDESILKMSSSGGIFSALAKYVLSNNGIVFGASWNTDWKVDMIAVTKEVDLPKLYGSKYLQANIKETFKECLNYLEEGKLVLYSGIPCQLHALKTFLKKDYDNLILVDIACHGMPLPQLWVDYLETIKRSNTNIVSINFRLKEPDWNNYAFEVRYSDGKVFKEHHNKNKYMQAFLSDKYLKPSCYNCKFKNENSIADITIGDAWNAKCSFNEKNGISFIIARTQKGINLLDKLNDKIVKIENNYTSNGSFYPIKTKPISYTKNIFKKRVAIITLHLIDNFGGILQALALNKTLTDLGYDCETLTWKDSRLLPFAKENIKIRMFDKSTDIANIKENEYDIFVVGSDQIWRHKFLFKWDFKEKYIDIPFLAFTNGWNKVRLSYAASVGVAGKDWEYSEEDAKKIKPLLESFNKVSVREIQSVDDFKKHFNFNCCQCLDPTMLLNKDDYLKFCLNIPVEKKDVFIYMLDRSPEKLLKIKKFCDLKHLTYFEVKEKDPKFFLAAFRDAKYVITDSFHGSIFSIIFNKPFINMYSDWRGNARFDSLIKLFNLTNLCYDINDLNKQDFKSINIDKNKLQSMIKKSKEFLINGVKELPKRMNITVNKPINIQKAKPKINQQKSSSSNKEKISNKDSGLPSLDDWMW